MLARHGDRALPSLRESVEPCHLNFSSTACLCGVLQALPSPLMLSCNACMLRYIRAIDASIPRNPQIRRNVVASRPGTPQKRFLQTPPGVVRRVKGREEDDPSTYETDEITETDRWRRSTQAASMKAKERTELSKPAGKQDATPAAAVSETDSKRRDPAIPLADWNKRRKELQHLADPLELANFVQKELAKGKETEMLQLVRIASRSMNCVVGWNHIIKRTLEQGKISQALKFYNEVCGRLSSNSMHILTIRIDEEARTIPRCIHLLHPSEGHVG